MGIRFQRKLIEATSRWPSYLTPLTEGGAIAVDEAVRVANDTHQDSDTAWEEEQEKVTAALELFNRLGGCFGIGAVAPKDLPDARRRDWRYDFVDYVNTGDTYYATLMFDYHKMKFIVGDWGTYCFEILAREALDEGILEETEENE